MRFRPTLSPENLGTSSRPCAFWQWPTYRQHVEFLIAQMLVAFLGMIVWLTSIIQHLPRNLDYDILKLRDLYYNPWFRCIRARKHPAYSPAYQVSRRLGPKLSSSLSSVTSGAKRSG